MQSIELWPFGPYALIVVGLIALILGLSYVLGERHKGKATGTPFESGIMPVGFAHLRFPVQFYLVAVLFVIFDMEAVFIFAWAVAFYDVGWTGYFSALIFIVMLTVALIYEWRVGALDWAPEKRKTQPLENG